MQSGGKGPAPLSPHQILSHTSSAGACTLKDPQTPAHHTLQALVEIRSLESHACLHTATMWGCAQQWVVCTARHDILTVQSCQVLPHHRYAAGIQSRRRICVVIRKETRIPVPLLGAQGQHHKGTVHGHRPAIAPLSMHALQTLSIHSATALTVPFCYS